MSEDPVPGDSPWRLLVLDRSDPGDPRWLLATVTRPADVRPAVLDDAGRYTDWLAVTQWVRENLGRAQVGLVPIPVPLVWRVDEADHREGASPQSAEGEAGGLYRSLPEPGRLPIRSRIPRRRP